MLDRTGNSLTATRRSFARRSFARRYIARRGLSLIETVVVMSLAAVLTGIVVSGVGGVYRFNRAINDHDSKQLAMRRFSFALREDLHRAESCRWQAGDQMLVMELAQSESLRYHKLKRRWVRSSTRPDQEPMVTAFGLDEQFVCECDQQEVSLGELIRVTFTNADGGTNGKRTQQERPLRCEIVAQVGRDQQAFQD